MFRNLNHALRWTFEVLERDITGYSNTAAIMRLGEQCGASASTSPDDLTIQEQKAQAVWVESIIKSVTSNLEFYAMLIKYNPIAKGDKVGVYAIANTVNYITKDFGLSIDIVCNIYKYKDEEYQMRSIALKYGKSERSIYYLRDKVAKVCDELQFSAETKIESALIEKGLINRLT